LIYLPLYEEITDLQVGVTAGSSITSLANPFRGKVVVYGSSITQGAAAARPGLAYPSIIGRNTGIHFINFGLSGSAKMEPAVADMINDVNADAYILDCVPNASSSEITANTAPLVRKIRARHPSSPIIMIQSIFRETGNFNLTTRNNVQTQNTLFQAEYDKLVAEGVTGLTMIQSTGLIGHDHEASVDGTHPNDLGFERMVAVIQPEITPIINAAIEAGAAGDVVIEPQPEPETCIVSTLAGSGGSPGKQPVAVVADGLQVTFSAPGETGIRLSVFNVTGALLGTKEIAPSNGNITVFVPVKLGTGVYILHLQGLNDNRGIKFSVK
jgi:lysophospholipase L1-like esterase